MQFCSVYRFAKNGFLKKKNIWKIIRRCRGSNPGHPRDRREYLPLYYNDLLVSVIPER